MQIAAQESHQSFCPHNGRQRPLLLSLCGCLGTFGSWSWSQSWRLSCTCSRGLDLRVLALDFSQQSLRPLVMQAQAYFPSLGWAMLASWLSLWLLPLRILGLTFLGFTRALIASACALMALTLLACIFFRPFLLCFLVKCMFLRNYGSTPLRESCLCDPGFLMLFLSHFQN